MLIELPTADEIDQLAITTPKFEVRNIAFEMGDRRADLDYTPCKGQAVVVIRGEEGTALVRMLGSGEWTLPSDRIGPNENIIRSAKRVGSEQCGLMVRSLELAGIYDVVWHYASVSIKRLHFVFAADTDDRTCRPGKPGVVDDARFFREVPPSASRDDVGKFALSDCSEVLSSDWVMTLRPPPAHD
jgi:ADP-ribose pyrophosphatase YjhB (NUDIX family)